MSKSFIKVEPKPNFHIKCHFQTVAYTKKLVLKLKDENLQYVDIK